MKKAIRAGIPACYREKAWPILCEFHVLKKKKGYNFNEVVKKSNPSAEKIIEKDLRRTFPKNIFFSNGEGPNSIKKILLCVSLTFPSVSYTQGMNCIAGFFSLLMSDEKAYLMFCYLFDTRNMENYFSDIQLLGRYFFIFEKLCQKYLSNIYKHFVK